MRYYIAISIVFLGVLLFLDSLYSKQLDNVYEFNKFVLSVYCHPNGIK